ncbi:conserved hypothetical protein [Pedobacter westerhofensis]|uniref:EthD domain-containing protein n=1 Tax=Pedobacter westerhofensis TaxID=425512 RepID=A0A521F513_9SPHI|nr:EthD domain-containing protein [Pedobacter westerhofensis]SMO91249.1 conserved hypothetical protein [Pedobacter westerhofensis]
MIKLSILLARKKELSHEEFVTYHKTNHAQLFASIPVVKKYVKKYVQCHSLLENPPGLPAPAYDGITEIWLDDMEALGKVFTDEQYMAIIRPDEGKFIDLQGCSFLISTENQVI